MFKDNPRAQQAFYETKFVSFRCLKHALDCYLEK